MNRTLLAFSAASFLSTLGNSTAAVALPLVILLTTGDPLATGVVAAATAVPTILLVLVAGLVVDRVNRRDVAVLSDIASAAAVAALPLVDSAVGLSLGWFIGLGIAGAIGDAPGSAAREAMAPAVARDAGLSVDRLMGVVQGTSGLALVAGPALAGVMIAAHGPTVALWVTCVASAFAAAVGLLVRRSVGAGGEHHARGEDRRARGLREGWRVLASRPTLRWVTALSVGSVMVTGALQGLILPAYALQAARPGLGGTAVAVFAVATICGAVAYSVLAREGQRWAWFVAGMSGALVGLALIAPLTSPRMVLCGAAVMGLSAGPLNGAIGAALVDLTPDHARGRVLAMQNACALAAVPLGVLGAGACAGRGGLSAAAWVGVLLWAGLTATAAFVPALRRLSLAAEPEAVTETLPARAAAR